MLYTLSVVVTTSIFTEAHVFHVGLCGHYRQLFGMFGRSTCEKVTDPWMLFLLGWGDTAQPRAWRFFNEQRKYYVVEVTSREIKA